MKCDAQTNSEYRVIRDSMEVEEPNKALDTVQR